MTLGGARGGGGRGDGCNILIVALLLGIDRFMSECRSITNFIGNSVATIAVSRWEKEVTAETLRENLRNPPPLIPHAEEEPKLSAGH